MNNYKILILIVFMLSVVCISCDQSDDEETEEDSELYYEEDEEDNEPQYEEDEEDHNTIIIDDDEEENNDDELYDEEDEEDNSYDDEEEDDEQVDDNKRPKGGYPPSVVFSKEVQTCFLEIVEYFPHATMRENVTHAMEKYIEKDKLKPYAKNYYELMSRNLLRGDIPRIDVFCKDKAVIALKKLTESEASIPTAPTRTLTQLRELRLGFSKECKKTIENIFGSTTHEILYIAIYFMTTNLIEEKNDFYLSGFWDVVTHHYKLKTKGKTCMQNPVDYCIFVYKNPSTLLSAGSSTSNTDAQNKKQE